MGPDPRPRPQWVKSSTHLRTISRPQPGKRAGAGAFHPRPRGKIKSDHEKNKPWGRASGRRVTKRTFNPSSPNASFWGVAGTRVSPPSRTSHPPPDPQARAKAQPRQPAPDPNRPPTGGAPRNPPHRKAAKTLPTPDKTSRRRQTHTRTHAHAHTHTHTHTQFDSSPNNLNQA